MAGKKEREIPLEELHDNYWTAPKLWMLGAVTLGSALVVIWLLSNIATRPM